MKKKSLLLVLAAVAVAATLGTACTSPESEACAHENWSSKYDADKHWQQCDECGETQNEGVHVDVKNNETDVAGADGKCDDCGYEFTYTVTFNMNGYGTAPDAQKVKFGATVTQPDGYGETVGMVFGGWYADSDCNTAFDFTKGITADTTVYAKWSPDTKTPGYTAANPQPLEENEELVVAFGLSDKLYFSISSTKLSRYQVELLNRKASLACTYVTDKDGEDSTVKADGVTYFDFAADSSVLVTLTRGDGVADTDKVGVYFTETTNEPVPAVWKSGTYEFKTISCELNTATSEIIIGEVKSVYNYIGGCVDKATFTVEDATFTFTKVADKDAFAVSDGSDQFTLELYVAPDPVPVTAFGGVYTGTFMVASQDSVTEVGIYDDGTGYIVRNNTKYKYGPNQSTGYSANYDVKHNRIYFYNFAITIAYGEDGAVAGIYFDNFEDLSTNAVLFERKGDLGMPFKLPMEDGDSYMGKKVSIAYREGSYYFYKYNDVYEYWNTFGTIDDDNSTFSNGVYSIVVNPIRNESIEKYTLKISDNNKAIEVSAITENIIEGEEGSEPTVEIVETLVETINKFEYVFHDLPASGNVTIASDDFISDLDGNSYYLFKVVNGGWYAFTSEDWLSFNYNLTEANPTDWQAPSMELTTDPAAVYLAEGSVLKFGTAGSFSFAPCETPKGKTEETAYVIEEAGVLELGNIKGEIYVKFAPAVAGDYTVKVTFADWDGSPSPNMNYKVNGVFVGYVDDWSSPDYNTWSGITADNPEYPVTVEAGRVVWIIVDGGNYGKDGVTVTVAEDKPPVEIFTAEQAGEYKGTGSFYENPTEVTLTFDTFGKGTFAWLSASANISITENEGTYSFSYNGNAATFTLNADGTITLNTANLGNNLTLAKGGAPVVPTPEKPEFVAGTYKGTDGDGSEYTLNIAEDDKLVYRVVVNDQDPVIESGELALVNNVWVFKFGYFNVTFTLNDGGTITIEDSGATVTLTKSADEVIEIPAPSITAGKYVGTTAGSMQAEITLEINEDYTAIFTYDSGEPSTFNVTLTKKDGGYIFTYVDYGEEYTCTVDVKDYYLVFTDEYWGTANLSLVPSVALVAGTYTGTGTIMNTELEITFIVDKDCRSATYITDDTYKVSIVVTDDGYSFKYAGDYTVTFTLNDDGSLSFDDSGDTFTLTLDDSSDSDTSLTAGRYSATGSDGTNYILIINEDLATGSFKYGNNASDVEDITLTNDGEGMWSFTYLEEFEVMFNVNADGSLSAIMDMEDDEVTFTSVGK